jgi:putative phage-type endonuclease
MEQRTPEWFAARAGCITASRAADLMARTRTGPAASRENLIATLAVELITGQCVETFTNAAMARGVELEPLALAHYEFVRGVEVEPAAFIRHPTLPRVGCSPDGLVGTDGLVEIKCPAAMAKHLAALRSGAHATEYRWQLQCQMAVTGRQWVEIASFDPRWPEHLRLAITRVDRDPEAIAEFQSACREATAEIDALVFELKMLGE